MVALPQKFSTLETRRTVQYSSIQHVGTAAAHCDGGTHNGILLLKERSWPQREREIGNSWWADFFSRNLKTISQLPCARRKFLFHGRHKIFPQRGSTNAPCIISLTPMYRFNCSHQSNYTNLARIDLIKLLKIHLRWITL